MPTFRLEMAASRAPFKTHTVFQASAPQKARVRQKSTGQFQTYIELELYFENTGTAPVGSITSSSWGDGSYESTSCPLIVTDNFDRDSSVPGIGWRVRRCPRTPIQQYWWFLWHFFSLRHYSSWVSHQHAQGTNLNHWCLSSLDLFVLWLDGFNALNSVQPVASLTLGCYSGVPKGSVLGHTSFSPCMCRRLLTLWRAMASVSPIRGSHATVRRRSLRQTRIWIAFSDAPLTFRPGTCKTTFFCITGQVEGPRFRYLQSSKRHPCWALYGQGGTGVDLRIASEMKSLGVVLDSRVDVRETRTSRCAELPTAPLWSLRHIRYLLPR